MSYWGKFFGGMAGFAMGGPMGALFGASIGHALDNGAFMQLNQRGFPFDPARIASLLGQREQIFTIVVTTLAAKLAKCDGPVNRAEIDAFRTTFNIPDAHVQDIGRVFDQARDSADGFEIYARQLGLVFSDNRGLLEQVLAGLYQIAKADGALTNAEMLFLAQVSLLFGLDSGAAGRAGRGVGMEIDPYEVIGLPRSATDAELRARWKLLVRENHPDSLAAKGVPADQIKAATDRVAKINAAYDVIKRERKL